MGLLKMLTKAVGNGDNVLNVRTELVARKKVLNPRTGLYEYTGDKRRVVNKVVQDAFVEFIVDQLITETSVFGDFKYHHSGIGTGVESAADGALGTPKEDARNVGTQIEGASANIYKSVATTTYTDTWAITEHGLFNTAGTGGPPVTGGIMMDRTKFAAINVVATNQIEWTFTITFTAGG